MLGIELSLKIKEHIEKRIREMLEVSLTDLRKLEYVHNAENQRCFLSGKTAAYEEILKILGSIS